MWSRLLVCFFFFPSGVSFEINRKGREKNILQTPKNQQNKKKQETVLCGERRGFLFFPAFYISVAFVCCLSTRGNRDMREDGMTEE